MPSSTSLLIALPQELIRAGLRVMLDKSGIKTVGEAGDAATTVAFARKHKPDVVLLDAAIPGGDAFRLVTKLIRSLPGINVVLLSADDNPTYMARAHAVGAVDFLLMGFSQKELVTAIQNAAAGKAASGSGPFAKIATVMQERDTQAARDAGVTPREEQVLRHVALGLSNDEISRSLKISVETVKEHVQKLFRKLNVTDRTQAAVWAVQSKLV